MTVEQHTEMIVPSDAHSASGTIRDILATDGTYRLTREQNDGMMFVTTVKPHWWLLGTAMTIRLAPEGAGVRVTVEIKSQPWIAGDIFGFYPRYMSAFTAAVAKASEKPT